MPTFRNNIDDPVLPPAQSFAVVGPMPERLRLAYERQQLAKAEEAEGLVRLTDEDED